MEWQENRLIAFARRHALVRLIVSLGCASALLYLVAFAFTRPQTEFDFSSSPSLFPLFSARDARLLSIITLYWGAGTHLLLVRFGHRRVRDYTLSFTLFAVMFTLAGFVPLSVILVFGVGHDPSMNIAALFEQLALHVTLLRDVLNGAFVVLAGPLIWWLFYRLFARIPW